MRTHMQPDVTAMFDQATQALDTAMQAGARLQGEAMHWWSQMLREINTLPGMQRSARSLMTELIPSAQQNVDQYLMLIDNTCQRNLDLLRRALEAGQSQSYGEAQQRMLAFWQASLDVLQSDTQELTQVNTRVMKTLSETAEHNIELATEAVRGGAQAAGPGAKSASQQATGAKRKTSNKRRRSRAASAHSRKQQ